MTRKAFTLIEVMAVVVILGLMAAGTALLLADNVRLARTSDVIDRLIHEDNHARLAARRSGTPTTLRFDLDRQRLSRIDRTGGEGSISHAWSLPESIRIEQIALLTGNKESTADIQFSTAGYCQTYALKLACKTSDEKTETFWLVIAGLTGQAMRMEHADEVDNLFALLAAPAMTLVEVLAALVIMGTLLAGMVMAKVHHTRQLALAQQRLAAVRVADHLIGDWWSSPQGIPIGQRGTTEEKWAWTTRLVDNSAVETLGARVVRVEVRPTSEQPAGDATVSVDLVLPNPREGAP